MLEPKLILRQPWKGCFFLCRKEVTILERRLERRKKSIKKRLAKPNTLEEWNSSIDGLNNLEIRQRYDNKKRSKKLRIRVTNLSQI